MAASLHHVANSLAHRFGMKLLVNHRNGNRHYDPHDGDHDQQFDQGEGGGDVMRDARNVMRETACVMRETACVMREPERVMPQLFRFPVSCIQRSPSSLVNA